MKFERKISKWGGSTGCSIPQDLLRYLELEIGDEIIIQDEMGKHGPYMTLWKKGASNDSDENL